MTPPGQEISKTINPDAGFGSGRDPSRGPGTSGGDGDGLLGVSSAATAADSPAAAGGISVVGNGSTGGGIQTVAGGDVPDVDLQVVDAIPVPLDPVTEAMTTAHALPYEGSADSFSALDVDDDLAIPAEVDLDDGL